MGLSEVEITTEPSVEPLTTAEFHTWANLNTAFTDDDAAVIPNVIKSARQMVERYLNRALITQTITAYFDSIQEKMYLPFNPVISVATVKRKRLDVSTTLTLNTDYYIQGNKDKFLFITNPLDVVPGTSPRDTLNGFELEVKYDAGYGDASTDVPQNLIDSVAMVAVGNYTARKGGDKVLAGSMKLNIINQEVQQKLNSYRIYSI